MAKPMLNMYSNLEQEFETVQKSLFDIDNNIRKVTGKDPRTLNLSSTKLLRGGRRVINTDGVRRVPLKRRLTDVDDKEEELIVKRSLQSQVVTTWEAKQRDQVLEEQKNDTKSLSRNKRMFGLLLGTLEKFKTEEMRRKDTKREEIEKKLDQADEQEREALKKERIQLFKQRKEKRIRLKLLESKLQRVESHKEWEKSQQFLSNYIETKTKPNIFYMPVKHNSETLKRLQETKDKYKVIFAEKRAKVQKELSEIEEQFKSEYKLADDDVECKIESNQSIEDGHQMSEDKLNKQEEEDHKYESSEEQQPTADRPENGDSNHSYGNKKAEVYTNLNLETADHTKVVEEISKTNESFAESEKNIQVKSEQTLESDKDFEPIYD